MKIQYIIIAFVFVIAVWSCQEETYTDPDYPTIIKALSSRELQQKAGQLAASSLSEFTVIDTFGVPFLIKDYDDSIRVMDWKFSVSKEDLVLMAKEAIVNYGYFLNVTDSAAISIQSISTIDNMKYDVLKEEYPDSLPPAWKITTNQQVYNGVNIKGTSLTLILSPFDLIGCSGHWYSEVYLPDSMAYSAATAKESIIDKRITYKTTSITPNEETSWHTTQMVVLPLRREGHIEMHVCWALYPDSWEILIDSESGEILSAINADNL